MKKLSLLVAIVFLFQSCYSYKSVEINPKTMIIGQEYKIERNHKTSKVVYTRNADSAIYVLKNDTEERIEVKDITSARQKKFSIVKTAAIPVTIVVGLVGLFALSYGQ